MQIILLAVAFQSAYVEAEIMTGHTHIFGVNALPCIEYVKCNIVMVKKLIELHHSVLSQHRQVEGYCAS
mgnify:FL=1